MGPLKRKYNKKMKMPSSNFFKNKIRLMNLLQMKMNKILEKSSLDMMKKLVLSVSLIKLMFNSFHASTRIIASNALIKTNQKLDPWIKKLSF